MERLPTLILAALLTGGVACAASSASGEQPAATPVTATPGNATPASAVTGKHSAAHCEKQARAKKLAGDAEKSFLEDCKAGRAHKERKAD